MTYGTVGPNGPPPRARRSAPARIFLMCSKDVSGSSLRNAKAFAAFEKSQSPGQAMKMPTGIVRGHMGACQTDVKPLQGKSCDRYFPWEVPLRAPKTSSAQHEDEISVLNGVTHEPKGPRGATLMRMEVRPTTNIAATRSSQQTDCRRAYSREQSWATHIADIWKDASAASSTRAGDKRSHFRRRAAGSILF